LALSVPNDVIIMLVLSLGAPMMFIKNYAKSRVHVCFKFHQAIDIPISIIEQYSSLKRLWNINNY